ncbi:cysteine hydrolase [Falsochrobactrum shanghaiense]|uniref:Cysteine hydrolase n=1 Tax=Falsochrobactrum shanghaiense TaxID=2201899 RepID=A0A316J4C7_9HYPH|nr:isochorismatase family cysteine hydrolase [Falsochrobactrum shanghaiense]PWL16236.1 cysteine hydrolase [Falsochrobactrum shanghaiense]
MPQQQGIIHGPLTTGVLHLCIDMQNLFGEDSPWNVPWFRLIIPPVVEICRRHAQSTIFTRFIPPASPLDAVGAWKRYYNKWADLTLEHIDPMLLELAPPLREFIPPARVLDKSVYSPWTEGRLQGYLQGNRIHTLVITGAETDLCVLAGLLGAVDRGYRVIIVSDAVCSTSDQSHDAILSLCHKRFSEQLEVISTQELCAAWP